MTKVHILTNNQADVGKRGLLAEHGLSLWIEKDDKRILFDVGQSVVFSHNAGIVGVDLGNTDFIVLSHGHYDHCGGLEFFPPSKSRPSVYAHPDIFLKRFAINDDGTSRQIGIPWDPNALDWLRHKIVYTRQPLLIDRGIMVSGEIPRTNSFEGVPDNFFLEKEGKMERDMLLDEQMLLVEEKKGIAIFLGCSHPGVVNCLRYAQELFPGKDMLLLVAGMHLEKVIPARLRMTIQSILDIGVQKVVPLHCTGFTAMCEIKHSLGERCQICSVGDCIEF
jgi:7,8-dihydropterin-6-yl-methyl-4-(beta-D-ribofuranosyl)aminobenzene 5'-phosphate synthase